MPRHVATLSSFLGVLLMAGCSGQSSPPAAIEGTQEAESAAGQSSDRPPETFPYLVTEEVEYYLTGPQQGRPPDGKFPAGTKVNVRRRTGGYWLVRSADGIEAYVLGEAIQEPGVNALP